MSLASLLNQTGTLYSKSTKDLAGRPSQVNGRSIRCRFEQVKKTIVTQAGKTEPIDGLAFFAGDETATPGDKFVFSSQNYRIMKVAPIIVGGGQTHHLEAFLQLWVA